MRQKKIYSASDKIDRAHFNAQHTQHNNDMQAHEYEVRVHEILQLNIYMHCPYISVTEVYFGIRDFSLFQTQINPQVFIV